MVIKMKKRIYYSIRVLTPWHTQREYTLSRDLQKAVRQEYQLTGDYHQTLLHALINVPVWGQFVNLEIGKRHYNILRPLIIPCKVLAVFIKNTPLKHYTQGQFISKANYDPHDPHQMRYMQHDYSLINRIITKEVLKYWNRTLK